MATVIYIKKGDTKKKFLKKIEEVARQSDNLKSFLRAMDQQRQMMEGLNAENKKNLFNQDHEKMPMLIKGNLDAKKYTGKIKSFGDGMAYQKK